MTQERIIETSIEVQSGSRVTVPRDSVDVESWEPGEKTTVVVSDPVMGWTEAFTVTIPEDGGKWRFRIPQRAVERRDIGPGDYVDVAVGDVAFAERAHDAL
jgi:hypothetical protein